MHRLCLRVYLRIIPFFLYSSNNIHQLETLCKQELSQSKQWIDANKLMINPKKSQACVINYRLRSPPCDIRLTYCNDAIHISDGIKYLGVLLDNKLNFLPKLHTLEIKLSRNVGVLLKFKKFFPTSAFLTLYFALIHPFLSGDLATNLILTKCVLCKIKLCEQ